MDATADERVRKRLTTLQVPESTTMSRIEIYDRGRLGLQFVAGTNNNPNLVDLYYHLCARSTEDDAISGWLRRELAAGYSADELLFGLGCASPTTKMPKHVVAQHASAFMPVMLSSLAGDSKPGIGVNPLDENGVPIGWRWYEPLFVGRQKCGRRVAYVDPHISKPA